MSYSENNTFEKILNRMLEQDVLTNVDKRVGSIIYDALAPCAMELANAYMMIDILEEQTYLMTATGANLDKRVYDYGISRMPASQALRIGEFKGWQVDSQGEYVYSYDYVGENQGDYAYDSETQTYVYVGENQGDYVKGDKILVDIDIPEGSRFAVPDNESVIFKYVGVTDGYKILECEAAGSGGNEYLGTILPITPINGLIEAKIISTYKYGEDEESDEDLRKRTKEYLNYMPYGGNIADYIEKVNAIDGVGNTKVFPAWQYNGSVLLSVVDPTFNPISNEFAAYLKNLIDPEEESGQGIGIAPIGHFVTITTPVEETVDVELTLETTVDAEIGEVHQQVEEIIAAYFNSVRKQFAQDVRLALYRSRIIELILQGVPEVINVTDVLLNNADADIVYTDEGQIGMQYLPKLGEVTIN